MTDTERSRIETICKIANIKDIGDLSDGFHTFNQLYYQRMMLFAVIVKQNKDKAWKSRRHEDGELCFGGGWFVVGVDTPQGSYTYHYEEKYIDIFDCIELPKAKHWDGHTEQDIGRLFSLQSNCLDNPNNSNDTISRQEALDAITKIDDGINMDIYTNEIRKLLRELPYVQPERKTGYWIVHRDWIEDGECGYECSECGRCYDYGMNFCGYCGAKMAKEKT